MCLQKGKIKILINYNRRETPLLSHKIIKVLKEKQYSLRFYKVHQIETNPRWFCLMLSLEGFIVTKRCIILFYILYRTEYRQTPFVIRLL